MASAARWFETLIGLRYIRARGRGRFLSFIAWISMAGIAIGVAVLIVVLSVMNGFETELRERILGMASHASITSVNGAVRNWRVAADIAGGHPEVEATAPFVAGEAIAINGTAIGGLLVRGVEPAAELAVGDIENRLVAGSLSELEAGAWNIVLGQTLADELGVAVGDRVSLVISRATVTPVGVLPRSRAFTVAGIFSAGMHEFDSGFGLINLSDAARLYQLGDAVSGVRLRLADMFAAPRVVREVAVDLGGGFYLDDWTRSHANFFRSIQITKSVMFVILLLVVGVAAFNIVSTLVMVVKDKQGDIAILRTIGATPRSIMSIFIVQGTVIGVVGTVIGVALGVLLALNIEAIVGALEAALGIRFLAPSVYFISDLPARVRSGDVATIAGTAFALSALSTLYPAWRAARTKPAEALRYE
ncbi:MAG: lipoprotein-releasing ABC transporter permease subunit [Pseudomonadota bacterium]